MGERKLMGLGGACVSSFLSTRLSITSRETTFLFISSRSAAQWVASRDVPFAQSSSTQHPDIWHVGRNFYRFFFFFILLK